MKNLAEIRAYMVELRGTGMALYKFTFYLLTFLVNFVTQYYIIIIIIIIIVISFSFVNIL